VMRGKRCPHWDMTYDGERVECPGAEGHLGEWWAICDAGREGAEVKKPTYMELVSALKGYHDVTEDHTYLDRQKKCWVCEILFKVDMSFAQASRPAKVWPA
jgi:hypothetical protein